MLQSSTAHAQGFFKTAFWNKISVDQTDDDNSINGFAGGDLLGLVWDSSRTALKLDSSGTPTEAELHSSWTPQYSNLIAYWKFNEALWNGTAGEIRDSIGSNHGVRTGTATTTSSSKLGAMAGSFPGNGSGNEANLGTAVAPSLITISAWVYRESSSEAYPTIIHKENYGSSGTGKGFLLGDPLIGTTNQPICFRVNGFDGNTLMPCEASVTLNQWVHYVAVFDGTWVHLIKNGVWEEGFNVSSSFTTISYDATPVNVGYQDFKGRIDDVAIWSTALDFHDIFDLYQRQSAKYANNAELDSSWAPKWSNLKGYWKMNEASWAGTDAAIDSSGNDYYGTSYGNANTTTAARVGAKAGTFDGSGDYLDLENPAGLQITGNISISAWVSANSFPGNDSFTSILSKGGNGTTSNIGYSFGLFTSDLGVRNLYIGSTQQPSETYYNAEADISNWSTNQWHHVVATYDGSNWNLYIDGLLKATGAAPFGALSTPKSAMIGAGDLWNSIGSYFDGKIDDVAIWNDDLTDAEVKHIYDRQSPQYTGTFTSRVMNANSSKPWSNMNWQTPLPFMKELPDYSGGAVQNESNSPFESASNDTLINGAKGFWHLNEDAGTSGTNSVVDASASNNHGTPTSVTFGAAGQQASSATFNGSSSYVHISNETNFDFERTQPRTLAAWIKITNDADYKPIIAKQLNNVPGSAFRGYSLTVGPTETLYFDIISDYGTLNLLTRASVSPMPVGTWIHVAATYDGSSSASGVKLYLNGSEISGNNSSDNLTGTALNDVPIAIGGRSLDLSLFNGSIDEAGVWDRTLSPSEIAQLYLTSPNNYTDLASNTLMNSIRALYHFNDNYNDDSGNGYTLTAGGSSSFVSGHFGNALSVGGTMATKSTNIGMPGYPFTVSVWVNHGSHSGTLEALTDFGGSSTDRNYAVTIEASGNASLNIRNSGAFDTLDSGINVTDGNWHHVVGVFAAANSRTIYVDGIARGTSTTSFSYGAQRFAVGSFYDITPSNPTFAVIDEVAAWNRALSPTEILQLHQRGASRIKFQIRTCNDAVCAGETWKGPDNTNATYFSELNNNTVPDDYSGDVKPSLPNLLFGDFGSLTVPNNQYFQYRAIFETYDSDIDNGPLLKKVNIGPRR